MSDVMLHGVLNMPPECWSNGPLDVAQRHSRYVEASYRIQQLERELAEVTKQRDELAKSLQLVWNHLVGERIRHDYITGTKEAGDLKTLQEVCKQALAAVK